MYRFLCPHARPTGLSPIVGAFLCLLPFGIPASVLGASSPGVYANVHTFGGTVVNADGVSGEDGSSSWAGVTFDSSGNMYGTAIAGGARDLGMVWEITAAGVYEDLHDFGGVVVDAEGNNSADGSRVVAGVTFDSSGNMYGTANEGGAVGYGMVWEITSAGAYRDLHDFGVTVTNADGVSGPDGLTPTAGVTVDSAGNLYGTASAGGPHFFGMTWEITASGAYKDLHDFGGTVTNADGVTGADGLAPTAGVAVDGSENVYGTSSRGGANGPGGMLWEITSSGTYEDLHDFGGIVTNADGVVGPDGSNSASESLSFYQAGTVVLDAAGDIYGVTYEGGPYPAGSAGTGMIWELKSSGIYVDLHDFGGSAVNNSGVSGPDGQFSAAGASFDAYGNMYGTTGYGGALGAGMVWELTSTGNYLDLQDMLGPSLGLDEYAGVGLDSVGDLFGTDSNLAVVWEISSFGPPVPPTALTAVPGFGQVALSWTPPKNAASYNVYRGTSSNTESSTPIATGLTGTTYTDTGLPNDVTYFYDVATVYGGQTSYRSNEASATTYPVIANFTVSPSTVTGGGAASGTITLSGAAPSGGMSVALSVASASTSYVTVPATVVVPAGQTSYTFNDIQTHAVSSTQTVNVVATLDSNTTPASLTILPVAGGVQSGGLQFFSEPRSYSDLLTNIFAGPLYSGLIANWDPATFYYAYQGGSSANPTSVVITPGIGYWAIFPDAGDNLLYLGTSASSTVATVDTLSAGWNSIGDPYTTSVNISDLTFGSGNVTFAAAGTAGLISTTLYYFVQSATSTTSGSYSPAVAGGALEPGSGYWIYAYSPTMLTFPLAAAPSVTTTAGATGTTVTTGTGTIGTTGGKGTTKQWRHY